MKWTKTPPTEPGWYWIRGSWRDDESVGEVRRGKLLLRDLIFPLDSPLLASYEWSDQPIPQPDEAVEVEP